ncbi:unnamed protein product [Closterium sp. NIES-64]|nr:unnamed protein product [Closterium sp. NIES-64]
MSLQPPTPSGSPCCFGEYVRVQQVAHTGVVVAGDMECRGSSCSSPNPPTAKLSCSHGSGSGGGHGVHRQQLLSTQPTHVQLILSLPIKGRGVGVNAGTPSRSSPVAVQVQRWEGNGAALHSAAAGRESIGIGSSETRSLTREQQYLLTREHQQHLLSTQPTCS